MLQTTDSLGKTTKNYYNALGELYKSVDRQGQATLYTYDARARLTKATAGDIINLTEYYKILFGNAVNFYNAQGQVGSRQNYVDHVPTQGYIYYDAPWSFCFAKLLGYATDMVTQKMCVMAI